jgi:hypothetical protein
MLSAAQLAANRLNARLSTGPRTAAGRALASRNAFKHGLTGRDPVASWENRADYEALLLSYQREFQPASAHERFLVDSLAANAWKLARARRIESAVVDALAAEAQSEYALAAHASPELALGLELALHGEGAKAFDRLQRYINSIERSYHRALRELRLSQRARQQQPEQQPQPSKPGSAPSAACPTAAAPSAPTAASPAPSAPPPTPASAAASAASAKITKRTQIELPGYQNQILGLDLRFAALVREEADPLLSRFRLHPNVDSKQPNWARRSPYA